jgi:hypothetical protein
MRDLILRIILAELSRADAYPSDWYGYARNQLSHFALGITTAAMLAQAHFAVFDEFAKKGALWAVIAFGYAAFEILRQGWNGRDTVEDWLFFAAYGAGLPIFLFNEVEVGSPILSINSQMVVPVFGVVMCHLAGGIFSRIRRKALEK